jgi:hypothetical protein
LRLMIRSGTVMPGDNIKGHRTQSFLQPEFLL